MCRRRCACDSDDRAARSPAVDRPSAPQQEYLEITANPGNRDLYRSMPSPSRSPAAARISGTAAVAATGDDWGWYEALFRRHHADLCGCLYRYLGSAEAAEDVVQDLFLSVWDDLEAWQARGEQIRPALFVAARNRALDLLKHRRVRERQREQVRLAMVQKIRPADEELVASELKARVEDAVAALPERCRLIFTLSREGGRTYAEIAESLGLSVKTVETQMSRALRALRERLRPDLVASLLLLLMR